jgi:hypothetical protein
MTSDPRYGKFHHHAGCDHTGRPTCKHVPLHATIGKHLRSC